MDRGLSNATGWNYWTCALSAGSASFGPYEQVVAHWRSGIPPGQSFPPRTSFDATDLRSWLGQIAIARIERDPFDVRFSLWGTRLTEWWGVDYTNRRVGEASKDPDAWRRTEGRYFAEMAARPFIGIAAGSLGQHDRSYKKVLGLDLPLGTDGLLTHVLAVHMQIDLEAGPSDIMPGCTMTRFDPAEVGAS